MAKVIIDRRRWLLALTAGGVAATGAGLGSAAPAPDDEAIELSQVPAKVMAAANKAVPRAKWTGASKSVEDGEVTYEIEGTDAKGRYVNVELDADGAVDEIQTEVPFNQAPQAVRAALKAKLPRFKATTTYEIRQEGKVVRYDFEGRRPRDKEDIGVYISADGKEVEVDAG